MKIASALVVVVGALVGHAVPPVDVPAGPGGRNKPGFVYDSARKSFVLFGGWDVTARGVGRLGVGGGPMDAHRSRRDLRPALDTQVKWTLCSRRGPLECPVNEALASSCCREPSI